MNPYSRPSGFKESSQEDPAVVSLSKEEVKAIKALESLSKRWPKSLELFGWSGTLHVLKKGPDGTQCTVCSDFNLRGIACDGGDPSDEEVHQHVKVVYE